MESQNPVCGKPQHESCDFAQDDEICANASRTATLPSCLSGQWPDQLMSNLVRPSTRPNHDLTYTDAVAALEIEMTVSLAQIEQQAISLEAEERAKLAHSLLASLHTPVAEIESAWTDEVEARVAAYDRGEVQTGTAEDVLAEARSLSN